MKPAALTATLFLSLIALIHLLRVIFQIPITAGDTEFPRSVSVVGAMAIGALAVWLWREQR
jgi:hypothetical protein